MSTFEEMMANAKEADVTKLFGMSKEKIDARARDIRWASCYHLARLIHGWSQEHVASKLRVSRQKISRFENGQIKALTPAQVLELAYILKIEPGDHPYIKDAANCMATYLPDGSLYIRSKDNKSWTIVSYQGGNNDQAKSAVESGV